MLSAQLSIDIKNEARRLGFFSTGIAPAGRPPNGERFLEWLRGGHHGEMGYLERQAPLRMDPSKVLEGARSVVVAAMNYFWPEENLPLSPLKGRISRYALGRDYHEVVGGRLHALLAFIRRVIPSSRALCFADSGPVMEKAWGAAASVGWMGKNTMLISREFGSWFFLGVILLDIELEYDDAEKDGCGSCEQCIMACPSGAIVAPYVLDARRCVSYLTQTRGAIPRDLRPLLGNRIFGCDACQEACPWNEGVPQTCESEFRPRADLLCPDLAELAGLSLEDFMERFPNSPILRLSRDRFVRNVIVALGNSGDSAAIPPLATALRDRSALVRGHAAWALGSIRSPEVPRILESASRAERDPWVQEELSLANACQEQG